MSSECFEKKEGKKSKQRKNMRKEKRREKENTLQMPIARSPITCARPETRLGPEKKKEEKERRDSL